MHSSPAPGQSMTPCSLPFCPPTRRLLALAWIALLPWSCKAPQASTQNLEPFVMVLGTAQDGGLPQIACNKPCCQRVREDPESARLVTSLLLVDPKTQERWLLDAGPDLPRQVQLAAQTAPRPQTKGRPPLFEAILLTHAHMGHIMGLLHLGRESYGAEAQRVICTPSVGRFLTEEAPWSLLVEAGHILIQPLEPGTTLPLNESLGVEFLSVPHRGEFTDTVAIRIHSSSGSLLYLPDIDKWSRWDRKLSAELDRVQLAFLDATFYGPDELPGRPMATVPHPFVVETIQELRDLPQETRAKVRLIHLNHTNPLHDPLAPEQEQLRRSGLGLAIQGQRLSLRGSPLDPLNLP